MWIFFGGHHKIGLVLGVISMYFKVLSSGKCTERVYCFGLQKFQIFWVLAIESTWDSVSLPSGTRNLSVV